MRKRQSRVPYPVFSAYTIVEMQIDLQETISGDDVQFTRLTQKEKSNASEDH